MIDRKIVKPVAGYTVMDPYGRRVPEDGAIVDMSRDLGFWTRRFQEGAITIHEVEDKEPEAPKPKTRRKNTEDNP